jgi:hypothetical protein
MRKRIVAVMLIALALIPVLAIEASAAYRLSSMNISHRVYEDGRKFDRLWIYLKDEAGHYAEADLLTSAVLKYNDNNTVEITRDSMSPDDYWWGYYDAGAGQWRYDGVLYEQTGYVYTITGPLLQGKYSLEVIYDGVTSKISSYQYNGPVELPYLQANAIISKTFDKYGNFICNWNISNAIYAFTFKNPQLSIDSRAVIDVYHGKTWAESLTVKIPCHMGRLFVPAKIIKLLKARGGNYKLSLQLRTSDSNNRYSSKQVPLSLPSP